MASHHYVITGASRGLGEALARQLLHPDHSIHCLSRTENVELARQARKTGCSYSFHSVNLAAPLEVSKVMHNIISCIPLDEAGSISLINNAAQVTPLSQLDQCSDEAILENIHINLASPAILMSTFIRLTSSSVKTRNIVNITSGSARYPAKEMSLYCSTKAALNMLTECAALEHDQNNSIHIIAVDPGMMDTAMQETARTTAFGLADYFTTKKLEGALEHPDSVARSIITQLLR